MFVSTRKPVLACSRTYLSCSSGVKLLPTKAGVEDLAPQGVQAVEEDLRHAPEGEGEGQELPPAQTGGVEWLISSVRVAVVIFGTGAPSCRMALLAAFSSSLVL